MAVNGVGSPSFASEGVGTSTGTSVATVQLGENNLTQVAQRLGIDLNSLIGANPQLANGTSVKPGQDILLPRLAATPTAAPAGTASGIRSDLPVGDPMSKMFVQAQLDGKSPLGQGPADIFGRNNLMYADPDGSGSGSGGSVNATTAAPAGTQTNQLQSLKSPDASLKTPSKAEIGTLNKEIQSGIKKVDDAESKLASARSKADAYKGSDINVISKNSDDVAKAEKQVNDAYQAMDQVLQHVVTAFGIGRDGATGLTYSPKQNDLGDTSSTASAISKDALKSPEIAASVIMHESNHARRNQELADAGIDRGKFGQAAEDIYSALTEMEGDQLEITNQGKLGTGSDFVKGAQNLKQTQIDLLKNHGAGDIADLAKQGKFDEALKLFRQRLNVDPHSQKYLYKK
jgi:tetratricopeptide (TPR) repeat protein